ncbi:MAG TPA: helix-turn-helix transcriptional regulator [Candidatus Limnocylindrales bacterium]|nr:helix-turn-helix transcriptional regulator [Candidatus Limnocylindrales bacterium]
MTGSDGRRRRAGPARIRGRQRSEYLGRRCGIALRECRLAGRLTQAQAADRAGVSQPYWSRLERGGAAVASLETLASCAAAVDARLAAFLEAAPGADLPRDVEHLRRQQLVIAFARDGGWMARPERPIDPLARRSRSIDVELARAARREIAVIEIVDLLADGGDAMRGLADKVAAVRREAPEGSVVAGLLVLRATARNRRTLRDMPDLFAARFPASSVGWLAALSDPARPMPTADGLAWTDARGERLRAARIR